ncbi:MAG: ABC transporter substrate-binding protein [Oscillospiraceae bacterium]|nr:ABC transporter substrate-binding protein [Oscillospiraceae bacterium]
MKNLKKALSLIFALSLALTVFSGCNRSSGEESVGKVRYLNFKPESADIYKEIAKEYEKETGVKVIVETAANNAYESTLAAKMATDEAPTLFQINGPKGYANWKDYCADLSDTKLYEHLTDKSLAVEVDGKVFGIPYVVEGYGIIYNEALTDKYFALPNKAVDFDSMDDVNSFAELKAVVEDMQKNREALGIDGVFAATSLKTGEDWRWQTHLANLPLYYEFEKNKVDLTSDKTGEIGFDYADNFKNIFDLYINNSTVDRKTLGTKTVVDSMAEFALEKCVMVQNGNWAWSQISDVSGNKVKAENLEFLPIYIGADGEEKQGLCIGTENFYAINSKASEEDQKAAEDFIYWLYSSSTGKKFVTEDLGFIAPFDTFNDNEEPQDPLAQEVLDWMDEDGIKTVPWNFTIFPSQTFKEGFGSSLLKYAQGTKEWSAVKSDMVDSWKKESQSSTK